MSSNHEYNRIAEEYDHRWEQYLAETHRRVLVLLAKGEWSSLLDVACGTGRLLERLAREHPHRRLAGVDVNRPMLEQARQRCGDGVRLEVAEAADLPFDDGAFDRVTCVSALHCFPEPAVALREAARVLAPDGRLILLTWNADTLAMRCRTAWLRWRRRGVVRVFRTSELEALLPRTGLAVETVEVFRVCPLWCLSVFLCRREGGGGLDRWGPLLRP